MILSSLLHAKVMLASWSTETKCLSMAAMTKTIPALVMLTYWSVFTKKLIKLKVKLNMMKMAMLAMHWISKDGEASLKCFSGINVNKREMCLLVETVTQLPSSITRFTSLEVKIQMRTYSMISMLSPSYKRTKKKWSSKKMVMLSSFLTGNLNSIGER